MNFFTWFKNLFAKKPKPPAPVPGEPEKPLPFPVPTPSPGGATRPQVIEGWLTAYDSYIKEQIKNRFPRLIDVNGMRDNFDPGYSVTWNTEKKLTWWCAFMFATSLPESAHVRTLMYLEKNLGGVQHPVDSVTGQAVRSEGLFQLSYQDVQNYGYKGDISWARDKFDALNDYRSSNKHGTPTRTLLDAYNNIDLALFIMDRHFARDNGLPLSIPARLKSYWYVLNPAHEESYQDVRVALQKRKASLGL